MPSRPLGLHYSTIGFNHFGKVAVIHELREELRQTGSQLSSAVGFQGTVAIGFASSQSAYNLKVIRNHPTKQYKWGEFEGIDSVLAKYRRVHEINRTGSMLDSIIFVNVKLKCDELEPGLRDLLLDEASHTVSTECEEILFRHLIDQRKMTPLPVFLENATPQETQSAIENLGFCIKNNAAANIFNKDLDARNYGVSRFLKVYLYDYDALEPFVSVKIRTNTNREDGEDDIPDWFFEDGVVFLPEELESGLMLGDRHLNRTFRNLHGDLLTVEYWEDVQKQLQAGKVPAIRIYPESQTLFSPTSDSDTDADISEGFYSPC
jgi:isocitrate dehydrogenase kinase/phosphatase